MAYAGDEMGGQGQYVPYNGREANNQAWGGYDDTLVNGQRTGINGAVDDVNRYQGLGAAAQQRQSYGLDWTGTAQANQQAGKARLYQDDAMGLNRQAAMGNNLQSMGLGQQMLQQGAQAQQAGAMSTRGGSLAQAAALHQQQAGQDAYMQQGNNMLQAQRADEMAQGRQQFMQGATSMHAGDLQGQQLNDQMAQGQQRVDVAQRGLNDQAQLGYEKMGNDVNTANLGAAIHQRAINANNDAAHYAQRDADRADFERKSIGAASSIATGGLYAYGNARK